MDNRKIYLVIHPISYKYMKNTSAYILSTLGKLCCSSPSRLLIERVQDFNYPTQSVIFILGDPLPDFVKRSDCFYVFINASLLYNVTGRWFLSPSAARWIREKHELFLRKLPCYDMVIDYYPSQAKLMKQEIESLREGVKVTPYLTNIEPDPNILPKPFHECEWNVCVVGTSSPRRRKIYNRLSRMGYRLSPYNGDLGSVIANSKLTLNVHFHNCDNLEIERIAETLKMGRCLVTENCYGLNDLIPPSCYYTDKYSRLVDHVRNLLGNPERMGEIGSTAEEYIRTV